MKRKGYLVFSIIGWLFLFCCMTEKGLAETGNLVWDAGFLGKLLVVCLVGGTLVGCTVYGLLCFLTKCMAARRGQATRAVKRASRAKSLRACPPAGIFGASWAILLACWLPGYLAYYPAICAYDVTIQLGQILGHAYNDHHPIFHTLLLEGFYRLGQAWGNVNLGIGLCALFQMLALSAAFAAGIALLFSWGAQVGWLAALLAYCGLFPFHLYMAVSLTKDTVFSAFFLLQFLSLYALLFRENIPGNPGKRKKGMGLCRWDFLYLGAGLGVMLFRTNGKYAVLVLLVFLFAACIPKKDARKLFVKLGVETLGVFILGSLLLSGIFRATNAQQGDRRELLSLPIQQLARTYVYHGGVGLHPEDDDSMGEAEKALVDDFLLNRAYLSYRPEIADPVKSNTNTYVARYRAREFLSVYLGLFFKYPGDYVNAFLAVDAGYLSPFDLSHATINENGRDQGLGYVQTRWVDEELNADGIYQDSKWEALHGVLEEFADSNGYLRIPVLKYILVPGGYLWYWLALAACLWLFKSRKALMPLALVLGYYLTLLLGPTVQLRYLYPVMVALPFALVLAVGTSRADRQDPAAQQGVEDQQGHMGQQGLAGSQGHGAAACQDPAGKKGQDGKK